jgi:probable rRNA maturation factor
VEFGVEPEEEIKRLIVHGILHLAGYDHEDTIGTGDGAPGENLSPMLKLQEEILQKLHIKGIVEDDNGFI